MCSRVTTGVQQANEVNVIGGSATIMLTKEGMPSALPGSLAADATQSAAGVQHGQAEPTLATVMQKLDIMQAQMNAMHGLAEAMAEAAFWRSKYAEATGVV